MKLLKLLWDKLTMSVAEPRTTGYYECYTTYSDMIEPCCCKGPCGTAVQYRTWYGFWFLRCGECGEYSKLQTTHGKAIEAWNEQQLRKENESILSN